MMKIFPFILFFHFSQNASFSQQQPVVGKKYNCSSTVSLVSPTLLGCMKKIENILKLNGKTYSSIKLQNCDQVETVLLDNTNNNFVLLVNPRLTKEKRGLEFTEKEIPVSKMGSNYYYLLSHAIGHTMGLKANITDLKKQPGEEEFFAEKFSGEMFYFLGLSLDSLIEVIKLSSGDCIKKSKVDIKNRVLWVQKGYLEASVRKSDPRDPSEFGQIESTYYLEGRKSQGLKNYEEAILAYNRAISVNKKNYEAYNYRAQCYLYMKDTSSAMNDYNKAIDINNKYAKGYSNRGLLKVSLDDISGALDDYSKGIEADPTFPYTYFNRGVLYSIQNKKQEAINEIGQALTLNPKDTDMYISRGWIRLEQTDFQGAMNDAMEALNLNAQYGMGYILMAYTALNQSKLDLALKYIDDAVGVSPKNETVRYHRAYLYYYFARYNDGINEINKAIEINPSNSAYYQMRGSFRVKLNLLELACEDFKKALNLGSQSARDEIKKICE